jgi:hypothetical protein
MDYDMAYFDMESHKVSALENPFGPKVLGWTATVNYVVGTECKPCVRYGPLRNLACPARFERATYALEEIVAAGMCIYFNGLKKSTVYKTL